MTIPNYAYSRCPHCGGEGTTGGYNHTLRCPWRSTTAANGPYTVPAATVALTLRFTGGREITLGRAIEGDDLCDDVIERRIYGMVREFLQAVRNAGVKAL